MKRVLLAVLGTAAGVASLLSFKTHGHALAPVSLPQASLPGTSNGGSSGGGSGGSSGGGNSAGTTAHHRTSGSTRHAAGSTASRAVLGSPVQTPYGVVQVRVTVAGSKIKNVQFVQLQAFDPHSQQINAYAAPILLRQTLSAQSAHIDGVSGATYTSEGYAQSVQSALDKAGVR